MLTCLSCSLPLPLSSSLSLPFDIPHTYTHVLAAFCQPDTSLDISGRREISDLRNGLYPLAYRQVYGGLFLVNDWRGVAQLTVGAASPGQVDLSYIRKQGSRSWRTSQYAVFLLFSALVSFSRYLPWLSTVINCQDEIKPVFLKLLLVIMFLSEQLKAN